jgi:hypothetical protein
MSDDSSPKSSTPIRARRWSPPPGLPVRSSRLAIRLIGIPVAAVAGVLIYQGLRDRFVLPECDSGRARHTLGGVLKQLQLEPLRFAGIKTVSSSKEEVVCSALLPLPGDAHVGVDYTFYWQGNSASMKYSVVKKPAGSS